MRSVLLLALLAVAFLAGGVAFIGGFSTTPVTPGASQSAAATTTTSRTVSALGILEPQSGVVQISAPPGIRIESIAVKAGDTVKAGDILAELSGAATLKAELAAIRKQIAQAKAQGELEKQRQSLVLERIDLESSRQQQTAKQEIAAQEQGLQLLRDSQQRAEAERNRLRDIDKSSPLPGDLLLKSELEYNRLSGEVIATQAAIQRLQLSQQQAEQEIALRRREAELTAAASELALSLPLLRARMGAIHTQIATTTLKAPLDGQILRVLLKPGEMGGVRPVLEMGDTSRMQCVVEVYESRVPELGSGGQSATIDLFGQKLSGKVMEVGRTVARNSLVSLDPLRRTDARVVEVRVLLEPSPLASRFTYLQVEAMIHLDKSAENAP